MGRINIEAIRNTGLKIAGLKYSVGITKCLLSLQISRRPLSYTPPGQRASKAVDGQVVLCQRLPQFCAAVTAWPRPRTDFGFLGSCPTRVRTALHFPSYSNSGPLPHSSVSLSATGLQCHSDSNSTAPCLCRRCAPLRRPRDSAARGVRLTQRNHASGGRAEGQAAREGRREGPIRSSTCTATNPAQERPLRRGGLASRLDSQ